MKNSEKTMEKIVALCKNRGYVYAGSEIYGGLANSWDYVCCIEVLQNKIEQQSYQCCCQIQRRIFPFADPVHGNLSPVALVGIPQPSDQGKQGHRCSHAEIGYHLSKVGKCIRDGTVKQAEHDHQCLPDGIALGIEDKRSGADEGCSQGHKIHTVEEEKGCKNQSGGAAPQGQLTL